jgi:uncharacterized protein
VRWTTFATGRSGGREKVRPHRHLYNASVMSSPPVTLGRVCELWRYPVKSLGGEALKRTTISARGVLGDRGWALRNEDTGEIHNAKRYPVLLQCVAAYRRPPADEDDIPEVDITFPDGGVIGSDSPAVHARLSGLLGKRVSLHRLEPATNAAFYRRQDPGAAIVARIARSRAGRRAISWAVTHTPLGAEVREDFARTASEPLPDFTDMPPEVIEFYTPPGTFFDVSPIHIVTTTTLASMARLNPTARWDVRRFRPNLLIETEHDGPDQIEQRWIRRNVHVGGCTLRGDLATVRCAMPTHAQYDLPKDASILRSIVRQANQCLGLYASITATGEVGLGDRVTVD